ncbi:MAG: PadR family transcriptional regulator [Treponema sp.]|jgi:DNA-binding PadR family transcriptional regulator|nr:PadR family transcriptional regulator [Treponema sp.]
MDTHDESRPDYGPRLSSDLLRGHTGTIVLGILHRGDAYGFEIYNTILEHTGERYELKETTLYSSYKRLEQEGCISSYWGDETQGARRRYYHLTDRGRETYRRNMRDWEFTRNILDSLMGIGDSPPKTGG